VLEELLSPTSSYTYTPTALYCLHTRLSPLPLSSLHSLALAPRRAAHPRHTSHTRHQRHLELEAASARDRLTSTLYIHTYLDLLLAMDRRLSQTKHTLCACVHPRPSPRNNIFSQANRTLCACARAHALAPPDIDITCRLAIHTSYCWSFLKPKQSGNARAR